MPNDMYTLNALSRELALLLVGGRIEKINQPEKDELVFYVRNLGITKQLVISVNVNSPRVHLASEKKDNPYVAPPFLMHLRRRLLGARIDSLGCVGFDRILRFDLRGKNEMSDELSYVMYIELLGRYSNIVLCDEGGFVTEALRHITPESSIRCILPHIHYELPPNNKLFPTDTKGVCDAMCLYSGGDLCRYLASKVSGLSLQTSAEVLARAEVDSHCEAISTEVGAKIAQTCLEFYNINSSPMYSPCVLISKKGAEDFFVCPYISNIAEYKKTESLNEAVRQCCSEKDRLARLTQDGKELQNALKAAIKKSERALSVARQKNEDCKDFEQLRIMGELITNSFYLIKRGDSSFETLNYYTGEKIIIQLNPQLSAQENAQLYYKKYAKEKRTLVYAAEQIKEYTEKLDYLYSIKTSLELAENSSELAEIREELVSFGILDKPKTKGKKVKSPAPLPPKEYMYEGFCVVRGRNNIENERVTFGIARENDIWLHTKLSHGSHVIIKTEGKPVPDKVLVFSCEIAAFYSEKQADGKARVDYCEKRFVKKHPSGKKGAVIYTDYKSLDVVPNAHEKEEITKKI